MFCKCVGALIVLTIGVGAVFAEEIRATYIKYADGKVSVKINNKEKEYTVDEKATMKVGAKEFPLRTWFEQTKSLKSGASKLVLVVEDDTVTGVKPDTGKTTDKKRKPKD